MELLGLVLGLVLVLALSLLGLRYGSDSRCSREWADCRDRTVGW